MSIELLAPAKDLETGIAAINCGADAVYIGAPRFGAREAAGNSITDIEKLIHYAHRYWARVYLTVNTLLFDSEMAGALALIRKIYEAGADALIVQDVGLLECDLPPIALFASTQMHNHTPERVAFLEQVGFKRVILARELNLEQIKAIHAQTSIELETFIHGALCVSYSGQCRLSYAIGGRSGNRGQCAQPCRNRYSLIDGSGRTVETNKHLLSIHDLNLTQSLQDLLNAGVTSFKIEGRLKDKAYVMNVVGHYRQTLDHLQVQKSSSGTAFLDFEPDLEKTFNRGYCEYFIHGRGEKIGSPDTPKMVGEAIGRVQKTNKNAILLADNQPTRSLHNGDGLSFFDKNGELNGTLVNRVEGQWISPARMDGIGSGLMLYRNFDKAFMDRLKDSKTNRKIKVEIRLVTIRDGFSLEIRDEDGNIGTIDKVCDPVLAEKPAQAHEMIEKQLGKLGDTEFVSHKVSIELEQIPFLPMAAWNELRRAAVEALRIARENNRPKLIGGFQPNNLPCPETKLDYHGNVLNEKAAAFYRRHGAEILEPAAESGLDLRGGEVMTTKYCLRHEMDACLRDGKGNRLQEPLTLLDEQGNLLRLVFDCKTCQMGVIFEGKS